MRFYTCKINLVVFLNFFTSDLVAFNSRHLKDRSLGNYDVYVFKETVYNYGQGYNSRTGIFTAPVGGMYLFTTSLCVPAYQDNAYAIVAKNVDVARSVNHGTIGNPCNSLSVIVSLNAYDKVYVRSTWYQTKSYENEHRWSTFSGLLVH